MYGVSMPSVDALAQAWLDEDHGLPSWMTVTRGAGSWSRQTAPAVDGTTFIVTGTAENTGRFDYGDTAGRSMLLIEPTRTNLGLDTNFVDAGADNIPDNYTNNAGAATTDYTVVAGGPHGGVTMNLLDTAVANRGRYRAGAVLTQAAHAFSVWARRTAAGAAGVYGMDLGGLGTGYCSIGAVACDWTRFMDQLTPGGGGDGSWVSGLAAQGDTPGIVETCMPQAELGDCATSWIPTTAATVARAAELCAIDAAVIGRTSGLVQFLWRPDYASTAALTVDPVLFEWAPGWELMFDVSEDKLSIVVNSITRAASSALTFSRGDLLRISVRYSSAGQQLVVTQTGAIDIAEDATSWADPGALSPYLGSRAASVNCRPSAFGDFLSTAL